MFDRQIRARVEKIAPFLVYDNDPYPVVDDGRIVWLQDAYTTTARYPYSTAAGATNYIRNSVKIAIDAYQGSVAFYLAEPNDPIVETYAKIFPTLFRPLTEMPAGLRRHVRYPEGIFNLQAVYLPHDQSSGSTNKEDQWEVPSIDRGREPARMEPLHTIMRLPGESTAEFIQCSRPPPRRRAALARGWWRAATATNGQPLVSSFPADAGLGPRQVVGRHQPDR
jgi:uncharacterized membrane protein (UPF0182 family)